ncbi:MAG TPA: hypothetical protein VGM75_15820 [Pseudonocardiaceae bacterium]
MSPAHTDPPLVRLLLACYPADYRTRYGAEMIAVSRERAAGRRWPGPADMVDLLLGAIRVRFARRGGGTVGWRDALPIVAVLAPAILIAGLADDLHDVAWFVYYGGFAGLPWREAAVGAPVWLAWAAVAGCAALGWRRVGAVLAWLATTVMVIALNTVAFPVMLPTTGAWLLLAVLASVALTWMPSARRGIGGIGRRRWLTVLGGVVLVQFARVLGHRFAIVDLFAWALLAVAVWRACRPATATGARAVALLAVPATAAALGTVESNLLPLDFLVVEVPWPFMDAAVLVLSLLVPAVVALVLRHRERARARPDQPAGHRRGGS